VRPLTTVIGEALVDLVPDGGTGAQRAVPGGSPFNVAVGLARLGNRTSLMARFADDRHGRLLRDTAAAEGIDLDAAPKAAERASVAIASVDADARATYEFDIEGAADWQWTAAELRALNPDTEVLHFGSIASWTPPGAERIDDLVGEVRERGGVAISYDPNVRPAALPDHRRAVERVEDSVRRAQLVKASGDDVGWLYPELVTDDVAGRWCALGAELVVVTRGADGASAYRPGRLPLHRPGLQVVVADTIGAGDAFTSGLLTGFIRRGLHRHGGFGDVSDGTLTDIVDEAVLVAAITCERAGADPPRLEELPLDPPGDRARTKA
jgi:fructokinase